MTKRVQNTNPGIFLLLAALLGFWPTIYNLTRDDHIFHSSSFQHPLYPLALLSFGVGAAVFGYYVSMHIKESDKLIASTAAGVTFLGISWLLTGFSIFA